MKKLSGAGVEFVRRTGRAENGKYRWRPVSKWTLTVGIKRAWGK